MSGKKHKNCDNTLRQPWVSAAAFFIFCGIAAEAGGGQADLWLIFYAGYDGIFHWAKVYWHHRGGGDMVVYLDLVIILNFLVDWFLLLGTNRLCGYSGERGRAALAAGLGSLYAAACLLPGFAFLGNWYWRIISLLLMSCIAFGMTVSALRRGMVFILLSMALGGIAATMGSGGFWRVVVSAAGVALLCFLGFRDKLGAVSYIPVEICFKGQHLRITALRDTGNTLRDPVTGKPVLVVGAEVAQKITGLSQQQLREPLQVIGQGVLPGSRLIPYRAVGQPGSMLLALRIPNVKVSNQKQNILVAFAPDSLCCDGAYQALTGGVW